MQGMGGKDTSAGGVSKEQEALAQYTFGAKQIGDEQKFASLGMGPSTNQTQAIGGARFGEALDLAKMSDADAKAMQQFNQQQTSALTSLVSGIAGGLGGGGGGGV